MDRAMSLLSFSSPLKRFYKFLLKRILGSFLQYDLGLDQLDVQLAKGELELRDLELNVQMLNELCVDLPITFIRARIRLVRATIPWRNLLSKSCLLKLDGWDLVVVPSEQVQTKGHRHTTHGIAAEPRAHWNAADRRSGSVADSLCVFLCCPRSYPVGSQPRRASPPCWRSL